MTNILEEERTLWAELGNRAPVFARKLSFRINQVEGAQDLGCRREIFMSSPQLSAELTQNSLDLRKFPVLKLH
jgi:hypothetical protein